MQINNEPNFLPFAFRAGRLSTHAGHWYMDVPTWNVSKLKITLFDLRLQAATGCPVLQINNEPNFLPFAFCAGRLCTHTGHWYMDVPTWNVSKLKTTLFDLRLQAATGCPVLQINNEPNFPVLPLIEIAGRHT